MNRELHNPDKILLVNDSLAVLAELEQLLAPLNVICFKANSASEALNFSIQHQFSLIIIDFNLPSMNAAELIEIMSWDEHTQNLPVIFLVDTIEQLSQFNDDRRRTIDYALKPINETFLLNKVKLIIEFTQQQYKLNLLQERHRSILENSYDGIIGIDSDGYISFANPAAAELLCWQVNDFVDKTIFAFYDEEREVSQLNWRDTEIFKQCVLGDIYVNKDTEFLKNNDHYLPVKLTAIPLHDSQTNFQGLIIIFNEIITQKMLDAQLSQSAQIDVLTELPNRMMFEYTISQTIARANRHDERFALLLISIDEFDKVKENFGHQVADIVLSQYAQRLEHNIRVSDGIARVSENEFSIIIDNIANNDDVANTAKKLHDLFKTPFIINKQHINLQSSIGIAHYPDSANEMDALIQNADIALYYAKQSGGNQTAIHDHTMSCDFLDRNNIQQQIKAAIDLNELYFVFQPHLQINNQSFSGIDCHLRWHHRVHGDLEAKRFIHLASNDSTMALIDEFVITECSKQLKKWQDNNILIPKIAFCIDSPSYLEEQLAERILQFCNDFQIIPSQFELKVKENVLTKLKSPKATLEHLHALGINIALDDFGSKYSSLENLLDLSIDSINFNENLCKNITKSKQNKVMQSIISICKNQGFTTNAKCIETVAEMSELKIQGCDYAAGRYYSAPLTADELAAFVEEERILRLSS